MVGGQQQLWKGISKISIIHSRTRDYEFGAVYQSEDTGILACSEIYYVVLPEAATDQTASHTSKIINSCVTKMLENADKNYYRNLAISVDFMDTKDENTNRDLVKVFVKAVKNSRFLQGNIIQKTFKNVQEIHLIGRSEFVIDCLKANLEKDMKSKATQMLDMSDSQFSLCGKPFITVLIILTSLKYSYLILTLCSKTMFRSPGRSL